MFVIQSSPSWRMLMVLLPITCFHCQDMEIKSTVMHDLGLDCLSIATSLIYQYNPLSINSTIHYYLHVNNKQEIQFAASLSQTQK